MNHSQALQLNIKEINNFIVPRIGQDKIYQKVKLELDKIARSINKFQPSIQIFSQNQNLSQALNHFFTNHPELSKYYQVKISELPTHSATTTNQKPILLLKANEYFSYPENHYELNGQKRLVIGRDSANNIAFPQNKKLSGYHAEIKPVIEGNNTTWVINDLQSRNGTYVNGQKIQNPRPLKSGDKITLAYSSSKPKATEFIFQSPVANHQSNPNKLTIKGDIVCLIVDSKQTSLNNSEKALIEQISNNTIANLIILKDILDLSPQTLQQADHQLSTIEKSIQKDYPLLTSICDSLTLPISITYPDFNTPSPKTKEFFPLIQHLSKSGKNHLFIHKPRILLQIRHIENYLNEKEQKNNTNRQASQKLLLNKELGYWVQKKRKAISEVRYDKEEIFRQINQKLYSTRNNLTFLQLPNSLLQKLEQYINQMDFKVIKQDDKVCLQLEAKNNLKSDEAVLKFCQEEISIWAEQQWYLICNNYANGGLNGLYRRSYDTLNFIPSINLENKFQPVVSQINWQNTFQESFIDFEGQKFNRDNSNPLMDFAMRGAGIAGMAFINPLSAIIQAPSLFSMVGRIINANKIKELKLEQQAEQLKRTAFNHYQSIARYLLGLLSEKIGDMIYLEDKQFRQNLEISDELLSEHLTELTKIFNDYQQKQVHIQQEKMILQQIKQKIGN